MIIWHTLAFPSWYPKRGLRQVINKMPRFVQRRENQWRQRKPMPIISPRKQKLWNTHSELREDRLSNWKQSILSKSERRNGWMNGRMFVCVVFLFVNFMTKSLTRKGVTLAHPIGDGTVAGAWGNWSCWTQSGSRKKWLLPLTWLDPPSCCNPTEAPTPLPRSGWVLPFSVNVLKDRPRDGSPRRSQMQSSWSQILIITVCIWETNEGGCQLNSV